MSTCKFYDMFHLCSTSKVFVFRVRDMVQDKIQTLPIVGQKLKTN